MNGGSRIIALDGSQVDGDPDGNSETAPMRTLAAYDEPGGDETSDEYAPDDEPVGRLRWIVPVIAGVLIAGWTVLFCLGKAAAIRHGAPSAFGPELLVDMIAGWALPVMLVLVGVLIARRR